MKSFFNNCIYKLIYTIFYTFGLIPFKIRNKISYFIGMLWYYVDKRHRNVAIENISKAYGESLSQKEKLKLAKSVFVELPKLIFETGWSLRLDKNSLKKHIKIEGQENIDEAFKRGKGVIILTGHLGSWELLTVVPGIVGNKFHDIYRPMDFPPLRRFFHLFRTRFGMGLIPKKKAMREIIRALSRGEGVGIPLDQSCNTSAGVFVNFFGHQTCTNKAIARIAMKTSAAVVPIFLVREDNGYKVVIDKIVDTIHTGDRDSDVKRNTEKYNGIIEKFIREYPNQWFWVHNRWKTKNPDSN